jgi:chromosome segregation ATPase
MTPEPRSVEEKHAAPPPETDVEALADSLRAALDDLYHSTDLVRGGRSETWEEARHALTALLQHIETLTRRIGELDDMLRVSEEHTQHHEAQVETLARERDFALALEPIATYRERAEAAEAKLAEAASWAERAYNDLNAQIDAAPPSLRPYMEGLADLVATYPAALRSLRGEGE